MVHQALAYMTELKLMTEVQEFMMLLLQEVLMIVHILLQADQLTILQVHAVMIQVHAAALCQQEATTLQAHAAAVIALLAQAAEQATEDKFLLT